ncbi:MAG: GNAT family N-acetyltransferase [Dokdonella sp.]
MIEAAFHSRLDEIPAASWDGLRHDDHPFTAHAFLAGLERHDCLRADAGWKPHHLGLYENDQLIAAAPLYLKYNSHGEFVFDWSWAGVYAQHGLEYYPKLLTAVPYSPVTGPRLLVRKDQDSLALRRLLIETIRVETERLGLSSAHVTFVDAEFVDAGEASAFAETDWLPRFDWQFHWENRGWCDFEGFLTALNHKKRKNIRHERRLVADAGIVCEIRHGDELTDEDWSDLHRFYLGTFAERGNYPALTEEFFRHLGCAMPRQILAVLCRDARRTIAAAIFLRSANTLYGRYWGAESDIPGLHFEACYYQGIEYCLREGLQRFEPGAQGEHKLARGFLPTATRSFHWIAHPAFRKAIASALEREAEALHGYRDDLLAHSPYRIVS